MLGVDSNESFISTTILVRFWNSDTTTIAILILKYIMALELMTSFYTALLYSS